MARAIRTGSVPFGLVDVPVGLYSATEDYDVHFNSSRRASPRGCATSGSTRTPATRSTATTW